jgi:hypothetical protein
MNKAAVAHVHVDPQTKEKAKKVLIPNELTSKTFEKSHKGEEVE